MATVTAATSSSTGKVAAPLDGEAASPDPVSGIGIRLAALRERQGRKMSALARQVGVSPAW